MLKLSRFNHILPWRDGNYLAFNASSGALGLLSSEHFGTYRRLEAKLLEEAPSLAADEEELLGQLKYGHFVVDAEPSELDLLKFRYRRVRYDHTSLGLVVAPTMACNMACAYCFEANKKGRMSPRVVEALVGFVEQRADRLKDVEITWYGGEPLLAFDIIEDITQSMIDLAGLYEFDYTCAGIITNGYLLDAAKTDRLRDMKVGQVQVTIDGPRRIHDQKRPLKNGQGSYDTIMQNVAYAAGEVPVVIRINIDKSFTGEIIDELAGEMESAGLQNRVALYFGQLEPATQTCANISESCYETPAYSQIEIDYYARLLDRGFFIHKLPHPLITFCFAQLANSFLIDPQGEMYRCFNHAGDPARSMGNIQNPVNYRHPEFSRLFAFDPFEHARCRDCTVLPLCMGSCPSRCADRDVADDEICDSLKYNLAPMLELVARSQQAQASQASAQALQETAS
jgi:uncharacterized protein